MGIALVGLGCSGSEEPADAGMVITQMYHTGDQEEEIYIFIYSDPAPTPSRCRAFLNDMEFPSSWFRQIYGGAYLGVIITGSGLEPGYLAEISVESDRGDAEGSLNIPDTLSLVGLEDNDTLPMGDLTITWSGDADFYDFWVLAVLYSPSGDSVDYTLTSCYTKDTSYTVPVDSLRLSGGGYSKVTVDIDPVNGVMPEAGASANMQGTMKGNYYLTNTTSRTASFYVGTPAKISNVLAVKSTEDSRNRLNRALGILP